MKKALFIVGAINAAIIILSFLMAISDGAEKEGFLVAGLASIGLTCLNLFVGIIVRIAAGSTQTLKDYGHAFLISSAFLLLCSFTLCSQGL